MQDLSMNKRVFCTKMAKYITPTNQRTPRVQKILPEGPQAGEKSMSARSTDYSHQGPPASQPPESRWLRRLAWFGQTSGGSATLWPPRAPHNRLCNDGCGGPDLILSSEPTFTHYKRRGRPSLSTHTQKKNH